MSSVLTVDRCVVRATHARKGRTRSLDPATTAARHLHYGRIVLDSQDAPLRFDTAGLETGLVALRGRAEVRVAGRTFGMAPYDSLYVPRDSGVEVRPCAEGCDLAEIAAPVEQAYPLQYVAWADVQKDPGLHFKAGAPPTERTLNILLGKNVEAGRIVVGVTFPAPGNWMSWPPHEHALEEYDRRRAGAGRRADVDLVAVIASGRDEHSVLADVLFVDPNKADYRVKDNSPALALGFKNFPMDQFGVTHPKLKALARTPFTPAAGVTPPFRIGACAAAHPASPWLA